MHRLDQKRRTRDAANQCFFTTCTHVENPSAWCNRY